MLIEAWPVDHNLLVPLTSCGHPGPLHTEALDVVRVVLHTVHLLPGPGVPGPEGPVQAGGEHHPGVESRDTLAAVLVSRQESDNITMRTSLPSYTLTTTSLAPGYVLRRQQSLAGSNTGRWCIFYWRPALILHPHRQAVTPPVWGCPSQSSQIRSHLMDIIESQPLGIWHIPHQKKWAIRNKSFAPTRNQIQQERNDWVVLFWGDLLLGRRRTFEESDCWPADSRLRYKLTMNEDWKFLDEDWGGSDHNWYTSNLNSIFQHSNFIKTFSSPYFPPSYKEIPLKPFHVLKLFADYFVGLLLTLRQVIKIEIERE